MNSQVARVDLAIIGTGFAGLGAGVMAQERGVDSFVILERSSAVGGTWRDNTYPGCACDIPSHLYSFSFAQNPAWSRSYPAQPEIEEYLQRVTDHYGLRSRIRFRFDVAVVRWLDDDQRWEITSRSGEVVIAAAVICATGPLSQPALPDIAGLDRFTGPMFHSASWRHDVDLSGRRVGVIGTGASAIQLIPAIAETVGHLTVFQRTPPWVLPRDDRPAPVWRRWLYRRLPWLQRLHRWRIYLRQELLAAAFLGNGRVARALTQRVREETLVQIESSFHDPDVVVALTPDYTPGCKRLLISSDWYPALARSNVSLVTSAIDHVEPGGVVTADGSHHDLDVLVLATGFAVSAFPSPLTVVGRGGVDLAEHWSDGAATHLGLTVSGFPNLWFLAGPGTGLGHNSIVFMIEVQLQQIGRALDYMRSSDVAVIELRSEVEESSYAEIQRRLATTVWSSGCSSWYQRDDGRIDTIWPGTTTEYWWRARRFDPERYVRTPGRFGANDPDR